jgi:hypothetical protein
MADAIRRCDSLGTSPETIAAHAQRFSVAAFRHNLRAEVERILDERQAE